MSVWVEMITFSYFNQSARQSRSTWACELKLFLNPFRVTPFQCHAPRERVSWNYFNQDIRRERVGHAPRERVSWNCQMTYLKHELLSHAPRERVSWNAKTSLKRSWPIKVTLHVSVWVEILNRERSDHLAWVTLHVSVWVEMRLRRARQKRYKCHAPRERVSWNIGFGGCFLEAHSHAPRERVSWNALFLTI